MAARNAINILIKLLGGAEMTAELKELGTTGEAAIKKIEASAKGVSLANLGGAINTFGKDLATVGKRTALAFAGISAAVAAAAPVVLLLAKSGAEAADQAGKAAAAAGLQADAYQKLAFAAGEADVSQAQFNTAMNSFNKEIIQTADATAKGASKIGKAIGDAGRDIQQGIGYTVETFKDIGVEVTRFGGKVADAGAKAKDGAKKITTGFQDLGIKVKDAGGKLKTTEQLLLEVANAFQKMPDGARKSAIAIKLFGESGTELIPFLNEGAKGITELGDKAADLGLIFSDDQIRAAQAFNDSLSELKKTVGGVLKQIGLIFAPAITAGAIAFRDIISRNRAAILDFIRNGVQVATVFIKDFFAVLSGRDADVTDNQWLIAWRDAIVGFGSDFAKVVNGVVIPAMTLLRKAAGLVTDAINSIFGTDLSLGQVAIVASLVQIVGGFRLLRSSIVLAVEAIAFFSRALLANPWLLAITAVAGGIALWATRTDGATVAMEAHQKIVDEVKAAYDKAQGAAKNWGDVIEHTTKLQALASLTAVTQAANEARKALQDLSVGTGVSRLTGDDLKQAEALRDLSKEFIATGGDVDEFKKKIQSIADATSSEAIKEYALALLNTADSLRTTETAASQAKDVVAIFTGTAQEAQAAIEHLTGKTKDSFKPLVDSTKDANAAIDETKAKVEDLGQTITVTRGGKDGISKEVFSVVDGIAHRADQSKAALDGVVDSAKAAKDQIQGVSNEVTNSVAAIPDAIQPDAASNAVDGIVSDVDRIAPAAQTAAAGVNDAFSTIDAGSAQQAAEAIVAPFSTLPGKFSAILSGVQSLIQTGFSSLTSVVNSAAAQINSAIARILAALREAAAAAARLRAQADSGGGSSSGGSQGGFASGGHVRGAGGPKTDSILAWLSNGEYVIQAAAVKKLGVGFLSALNNGFLPSLKSLRGFSLGGAVDGFNRSMQIPRLATGGMVPALASATGGATGLTNVKLDFGLGAADVFNMITDNFTASRLQGFAVKSSLLSTGRKPRRG